MILILALNFSAFGEVCEAGSKNVILSFDNPEKMFMILEGKWVFDDIKCEKVYTVTVAKYRKSIKFDYANPHRNRREKRLTNDGKILSWDFWFFPENEFS